MRSGRDGSSRGTRAIASLMDLPVSRIVCVAFCLLALLAPARAAAPGVAEEERAAAPASGPRRNEELLRQLQQVHGLSDDSMRRVREVFAGSAIIGQGNPAVTEHPATPEACRARLREAGISYEQPDSDRICGARYMAPLYDPARGEAAGRRAPASTGSSSRTSPAPTRSSGCGPARPRDCARRMGKRLCDAHEWEGACAGAPGGARLPLRPGARGRARTPPSRRMRAAHNRAHAAEQELELRPRLPEGRLRGFEPQDPGLRRRRVGPLRVEHLSRGLLSRVPQRAQACTTSTATPPST